MKISECADDDSVGGGFGDRGGGRGRGGPRGGRGAPGRGGRGGGGGRGGFRGGRTVVVEPHRHEGVFIARGKEDALVTLNLVPGSEVYGEKRISIDVSFHLNSMAKLFQLFQCNDK